MTREDAIRLLDLNREYLKNTNNIGLKDDIEALNMAIKALEEKQNIHDKCKRCVEFSEFEQKPCEDAISRQAVFEVIKNYASMLWEKYHEPFPESTVMEIIQALPSVTPKQTRWIPIKTRQMTEEEKEEYECECPYIYDCPLPDDGQEVFITDRYGNVVVDTFYREYEGCYFEVYCDDGDVVAWMPLPEPYKAESEEK